MGRKQDSSPMSFFSFQDIMACVTGIMILITLILALDPLSNAPMISPTPSPPSDLVERLRAAQQRAGGASEDLAKARELLQQSSADERVTGRQLENLRQLQQSEETKLNAAKHQLETGAAKLQKARSEVQLVTQELQLAAERAKGLRKEVVELDMQSRVKRQAGPQEPLQPLVIEVQPDGIAVGTLDERGTPSLKMVVPNALSINAPAIWASLMNQLLDDHPPAKDGRSDGWYGLFIIRSDAVPDGLSMYSNLHSASWEAGCQLWDASEGGFFEPTDFWGRK
ncbi:MAG: hypothetical protein EBR10_03735 [Planctomycetes bacterium]|nr:hypothetical protein [Planctomycetota bacterium]